MIKIALCEDDFFYLKKERELIENYFKRRGIQYCITTYEEGTELIKDYKGYNIIFLDISMEGMDGLEVARWLRNNESTAYIIFLSGYAEFTTEGYKVDAHRFLLKNDKKLELALEESLTSALEKMNIYDEKISFDVVGGAVTIHSSKIVYIDSKVHRIILHVLDASNNMKEYYMYDRLDHVQEMLSHLGFMRIHQSSLINTLYLKMVYRYKVELAGEIILGVSKRYYKDVEHYYICERGEI